MSYLVMTVVRLISCPWPTPCRVTSFMSGSMFYTLTKKESSWS